MQLIQQLTSDPLQSMNIVLPDTTTFSMTIQYLPSQVGWFITSLTYGSFSLSGVRITLSPNILYQFKNILPFGLACYPTQSREPTLQQDFASGAALLYLLTSTDVSQLVQFFEGIPVWNATTTYGFNTIVSYLGALYVSLIPKNLDNNPAAVPTAWKPST